MIGGEWPLLRENLADTDQYLAEDCQLLTDIGRRSLRSADALTCVTKRTRTRLGDRSFFRRWTVSLELSACRITWRRYLT